MNNPVYVKTHGMEQLHMFLLNTTVKRLHWIVFFFIIVMVKIFYFKVLQKL